MSTTVFWIFVASRASRWEIPRGDGWTDNGRSFTIHQLDKEKQIWCIPRLFIWWARNQVSLFFEEKDVCENKFQLWTWPIFDDKCTVCRISMILITNHEDMSQLPRHWLVYEQEQVIELLLTKKRQLNCVQLFVGFHRTYNKRKTKGLEEGERKWDAFVTTDQLNCGRAPSNR